MPVQTGTFRFPGTGASLQTLLLAGGVNNWFAVLVPGPRGFMKRTGKFVPAVANGSKSYLIFPEQKVVDIIVNAVPPANAHDHPDTARSGSRQGRIIGHFLSSRGKRQLIMRETLWQVIITGNGADPPLGVDAMAQYPADKNTTNTMPDDRTYR